MINTEYKNLLINEEPVTFKNKSGLYKGLSYLSSYSEYVECIEKFATNSIDNKEFHSRLIGCYDSFDMSLNETPTVEKIFSKLATRISLETIFFERELKKLEYIPSSLDYETIHTVYNKHPSVQHPLFEYVQNHANEAEIRFFLQNDAIMGMEFFDYLVLTVLGTQGTIKEEITKNLWDEAGYGDSEKFHTTLFHRLLKDLGIHYDREKLLSAMGWEALSGLNLMYFFIHNAQNKIRLFGAMAASELLDSSHYGKFAKGMHRVFGNKYNLSYYTEHEQIDADHADGWITKVVLKTLHDLIDFNEKKNFTEQFWQGFIMRLNSTHLYYDYILNNILKGK